MPLYEYECLKCKKRFERIQKFSDPPMENCPTCRGLVSRVLSSPAFQFKGSGWYATDYAKKNSAASQDSPPAADKPKESGKTKDSSTAKT